MATELITLTTQTADVKSLPLVTDIQYLEPFTSTSLNRKFCGVVRRGVFRGFACQPAGGMSLSIVHNKNQTGESVRFGVALVERDDYLLTVRQQHEMAVVLEAGKTSYVVLEAFYEHGVETTQVSSDSTIEAASIKVLSESQVQDHHIILCVATIPQGVTILTTAHLSFDLRPIGGYDLESHLLDVNPHKQYVRNNADSTVDANLTLTDRFKLNLGSADDLSLYHNGAGSYVDNHTGAMYMRQLATGGSVFWQAKNAAGKLVTAIEIVGGETPTTKFYAGGNAKLLTESAGISVVGKVQTTGEIYENSQRVFSPNNRNVSDAVNSTSTTIYASLKGVNTAFNRAVEGEKNAKDYADSLYSKLLGDAPQEALDTLTELAEMLNDGESAIAAINKSLATKADKSVKVSVTGALTGGGTLGSAFSIGVKTATTAQAGVVQLSNSVSSTSTAYAATANALKQTYDLAASKLDAGARAVDSALLGGLKPSQFLRSDYSCNFSGPQLRFNVGSLLSFGNNNDSAIWRTPSNSTVIASNKGDLNLSTNNDGTDTNPNRVTISARNYKSVLFETISAIADGTNVFAQLRFNGVEKLVTTNDGISIAGGISTSAAIVDRGYEVFSPRNKPTWAQVGGDKLWISDTFITAQGNKWIQTASAETGLLPSAEGKKGAGVSHIGSSGWWFKDAYIDNVYAKQLQTDTVTTGGYINSGNFIFAANSANTVKAVMGASSVQGEAVFGVTPAGRDTAHTYIRISDNALKYQGSNFAHNIFHEGNRPASLRKTASIADGDSVLDWAKSVASSEMAYASSGTGATDKPSSQTSDYLWVGHGGEHGTLTAWTSAGETYTNRLANGSWGGWKLQLTPGVIGTLKEGTANNFLTVSGGAYWIQAASNGAGFIPYADNQSHLGTVTMRFADANIIQVNTKRIKVEGAAPEVKLSGDANVDSYIRLLEADDLHGFYLQYAGSSGQNVSNIGTREHGVEYVAMSITRGKNSMVNFTTNPRCTGPQVDVPTALTNKGYVDGSILWKDIEASKWIAPKADRWIQASADMGFIPSAPDDGYVGTDEYKFKFGHINKLYSTTVNTETLAFTAGGSITVRESSSGSAGKVLDFNGANDDGIVLSVDKEKLKSAKPIYEGEARVYSENNPPPIEIPVGIPFPWPTDAAPNGYAIMKGQAYDASACPLLSAVYPDGVLPDMRGLAIVGKKDNELILAYEEDAVKLHDHTATSSSTDLGAKTTDAAGEHTHTLSVTRTEENGARNGQYYANGTTIEAAQTWTTNPSGEHAHPVTIGAHSHTVTIKSSGATENTIKNRKFNWIVRLA